MSKTTVRRAAADLAQAIGYIAQNTGYDKELAKAGAEESKGELLMELEALSPKQLLDVVMNGVNGKAVKL